jgi:plasmid maintenance system antidote protein VapI
MKEPHPKLNQLLDENAISEEEFAYCLGIEPFQAKQLCSGKKALTAKLARQIEQTFSKPAFWLDENKDLSGNSGPSFDLFG